MHNNVLYLIGGTCSGKTSLARILERKGWTWIRSVTTRPQRPGESDEYKRWMTSGEFRHLFERGDIVDRRAYTTHDEVWYYGFSKSDLVFDRGKRYVMIGDPVSARKALYRYRTVLMLYTSDDVVKSRLKSRGCEQTFIRQRLCKDRDDFGVFKLFANHVRATKGTKYTSWTAKNDNHCDRTKILNWLDERIPE
nr:MAG TPA: Guanylate kinase [Caudoviricetes sp.]